MSLIDEVSVLVRIQLTSTLYDQINFDAAAIATWSYRHGRPNITQNWADYSISVSFVRQEVETILAAEGRTLDEFCQLGNQIVIDIPALTVRDQGFFAIVTDIQRTRDTITLSGIDQLSFRCSAMPPDTYFSGYIGPVWDSTLTSLINDQLETYPSVLGRRLSGTTDVSTAIIVGQYVSSLPAFVSSFASLAPTNWIVHNYVSYKIPSGQELWNIGNYSSVVDRPYVLPSAATSITDDMIIDDLQYSRNISDIATSVTCTNSAIGASYTVTDEDLATAIGYRSQNIDALILYEDLQRLAGVTLAGSSTVGAPVITFRTTYKLANFFFWSPNLLLDTSAVTSPEFDGVDYVWIENVDLYFTGTDFLFTLTVSDARYTSMLQRWADVPGVRTWAQLPASQTWADTLTTKIT